MCEARWQIEGKKKASKNEASFFHCITIEPSLSRLPTAGRSCGPIVG